MRLGILALMLAPIFLLPALAIPKATEPDMARVELGWLLFYDPILSGNQQVACATCHHPRFGTSDGVSLSLGDGAIGLGPDRIADPDNLPEQRLPRNAPALFNLGEPEFQVMFHDGRLEFDATKPNNIRTPLGDAMAEGFDSVLAAQAMFPVLSADEMAGHYSENPISQAVRLGHLSLDGGAWDQIAARVDEIPEYRALFNKVLGEDAPITFADIGNVIADFMVFEWTATNSPYDRYIAGEDALSIEQLRGMELFYGAAGCGACHTGRFQTDHDFHAVAMPQLGPGKTARFESHARDEGRMRVTGSPEDAFAFRTPSLRNIAHTAPYGHAGAYATLEAVVRHHLDPVGSLYAYDRSQVVLPHLDKTDDWRILDAPAELTSIAQANDLAPVDLSDDQVADILAFLESLTDLQSLEGRLGIPQRVPSGLPVDR
ncbi:MAG: cytochrome c peroxidase [Pseudomonadota bacterium]